MACECVTFRTPDYDRRFLLLIDRGLTPRAASIVLNAAMFGIGCIEGEVRKRIEKEKTCHISPKIDVQN